MTVRDLIERLIALPDYTMPMVVTITDDTGETVLSDDLFDGTARLNFEYPNAVTP